MGLYFLLFPIENNTIYKGSGKAYFLLPSNNFYYRILFFSRYSNTLIPYSSLRIIHQKESLFRHLKGGYAPYGILILLNLNQSIATNIMSFNSRCILSISSLMKKLRNSFCLGSLTFPALWLLLKGFFFF